MIRTLVIFAVSCFAAFGQARTFVTVSTNTTLAQGDILVWSGSAWVAVNKGTNGQTLTMSGTNVAWSTPTGGSGAVDSVFGRTGVVTAQPGDYDEYFQGTNSLLTAVAGLGSNGLVARTGAGSAAARTITGDTEIVVSNGDGVSGNPTLSIGSGITRDAEAASLYQPLDATLTAVAGASTGSDTLVYFSAADTASVTTFTTFGRSLVDDASASDARTTLGLVIGTNVQAWDADLDDLADGSLSGSKIGTGIDASNITVGTLAEARIDAAIARVSALAAYAGLAVSNNFAATNKFAAIDLGGTIRTTWPSGGSWDGSLVSTGTIGTLTLTGRRTPFSQPTRVVIEGDSLSDGYTSGSQEWPYWLSNKLESLNLHWGTDVATANESVAQMQSDYTTQVYPYRPQGGTNAILFIWGGINDIGNSNITGQATAELLTNYWATAKADGFTVVGFTLSQSTSMTSLKQIEVESANNLIRYYAPGRVDYLIDVGAILTDSGDTQWTPDGVHWNSTAGRILADHIAWAITDGAGFTPKITEAKDHTAASFRNLRLLPQPGAKVLAPGLMAFNSNAMASAKGAIIFNNGTDNTYLVGVQTNDTPSNGQVPKFNTGGNITWEDDNTGTWDGSPIASGTITNITTESINLNGDTRTSWPTGGSAQDESSASWWWDCIVGSPASAANWGLPYMAGGAITSGTANKLSGEAGRPGIIRIGSSASANSGYSYNSDITGINLSGNETFRVGFRVITTNNMVATIGISDQSTATVAVDACALRIENGWMLGLARSNNVPTEATSSNQITINQWYKAVGELNADASQFTLTLFSGTTPIMTNVITSNTPIGRTTGIGFTAYHTGSAVSNLVDIDFIGAGNGTLSR